MKQKISLPYVYVVGNEKGGAGKTTCSMHMIAGLLDNGLRVASIDTDSRQRSLSRYIEHRDSYNQRNPEKQVSMPKHFWVKEHSSHTDLDERFISEKGEFESIMQEAKSYADVIVIDTPGSHTSLSRLAHSYADTIITPINDSFLDIDVMAKVSSDYSIVEPSIYSQMIWEQKMERAKRDRGSIEWIVMRNRLTNIDAANKRHVADVLDKLSKRIIFKIAPGFSERVIFRELFLQGLTLLDITKANYEKGMTMSHVAARQELREFLKCINLEEILVLKREIA
jgi:chromosome partitioning protein